MVAGLFSAGNCLIGLLLVVDWVLVGCLMVDGWLLLHGYCLVAGGVCYIYVHACMVVG